MGLSEVVDTLSCARGMDVRVPERMAANVLLALQHGIIDEALAAKRLRLSESELRSELDRRDDRED